MVLWFPGAMVPWFGGPSTFPTNSTIDLPAMLFDVTRFKVPTLLDYLSFFLRLSFRGTSDLPPFPFSGTHHVMKNNVFRRRNLTGQLYLVCKICWIHVRHVSTLCEPCGGCDFWDGIGFELDIL